MTKEFLWDSQKNYLRLSRQAVVTGQTFAESASQHGECLPTTSQIDKLFSPFLDLHAYCILELF